MGMCTCMAMPAVVAGRLHSASGAGAHRIVRVARPARVPAGQDRVEDGGAGGIHLNSPSQEGGVLILNATRAFSWPWCLANDACK